MRVIALSADASLAAALNMSLEWEVAYATEPEHAAEILEDAKVVLIGGGTEEGLRLAESLRSLGVMIPAVVVGDTPAPETARYRVVTPPFTLDELYGAVEQAISGGEQRKPTPAAVEPPPRATPPSEERKQARRAHLAVAPVPADETGHEIQSDAPIAAPISAGRATASAAATAPVEAARPVVPASAPAPSPSPAPAPRRSEGSDGSRTAAPAAAHGRGLLRRRAKSVTTEEDQVANELRAAFVGIGNVEKAIRALPMLTDLEELTRALIGEVVDLLTPETAGLYLPGPDGFRVWASHNFSNVEKSMAVQTHQPLFADLLVRHEAMLIEPLDLAPGLANGVGGARTNAFVASPIEVDRTCVGVIVAGRGHFENEDLDRLEALALEAALGLGIALGLDRLRQRLD